jgi:Family of unknown function (DUF6455)
MAAPVARERQPIYLCEMMERLGIEPGGGMAPHLGLRYATALRRCEACPSKETCRDWLDSMPASVAFAPRFCPNADIFFELQVDQPGAHQQDILAASPTLAATCPRCGHLMRLARTVPKLGVLPELFVFRCPSCNEVETKQSTLGDLPAVLGNNPSTVG